MSNTGNVAILASDAGKGEGITEVRRQEALLITGALQNAIFNSANFRASPPMPRASSRSSTSAPSACSATRQTK